MNLMTERREWWRTSLEKNDMDPSPRLPTSPRLRRTRRLKAARPYFAKNFHLR